MLSHRYLGGRSSSRPAARDVRDDPGRAPREAHTRLGFCTPARASPARPPPQDLLRRAGPVNRGAVRGRVQLDGRRLLLGHFGARKGAPNSEGGPSSFLPLSCPAPASRGQVRAASPKAAFGGRALRGPVRAKGPVAVWGNPRPTCSVHREPKGFPARAARQPGIPCRSPSVNRSPGARTTTLIQPQPGKVRRRHCRVPSGSAQQSQRRTGGRGRVGGGLGTGEASPPQFQEAAFSTRPPGSAPIASLTANESTPRRQMTRKYVTGRGARPWGRGPALAPQRPLPPRDSQVDLPGKEAVHPGSHS